MSLGTSQTHLLIDGIKVGRSTMTRLMSRGAPGSL